MALRRGGGAHRDPACPLRPGSPEYRLVPLTGRTEPVYGGGAPSGRLGATLEPYPLATRALASALGAATEWPPALAGAVALADELPLPCAVLAGPELRCAPSRAFAALARLASPVWAQPLEALAAEVPLLAALVEPARRVLGEGAPVSLPRAASPAPGGAARWLAFSLLPVRAGEGAAPLGVMVVVSDETLAVEAEARAGAARRELYEDFEQMLSVAAHDLKNPLNVISLSSYQLAMLPVPAELRERTKRLADAVKRSMRRIDDQLLDLLDLARLDLGPLLLDRVRCEAGALVDEALELLAPVAKHKAVVLNAKVEPGLLLECDRARCVRLLVGLIWDGIAASPEHGMVRLAAFGDGDRVRFEVHDMGPGIPAAELSRAFDRRAVRRRDLRPKAGRALALARSVVEAEGGALGVESPPGLGTLVRFWLPARA